MKRFFSVLLMAALLMTCMAAFSASYAESYVYFTGHANVRSGPGLGYTSIGQINAGSTLPYMQDYSYDSRGVCWYKVSFSGSAGWVSSSYASLSNYAGNAIYAAGANGGSYAGNYGSYSNATGGSVYATANAYVRSGPGLDYSQLTVMNTGDYATYMGNTSYDSRGVAWYNVSFNGYNGWVSSAYTQLTGGYSSYAPSFDSYSYGSYVVGTNGDSNVRSGPGLGYASIGGLSKGESAPYLGQSSVDERGVVWYNISCNGYSGWVSSRYTTLY